MHESGGFASLKLARGLKTLHEAENKREEKRGQDEIRRRRRKRRRSSMNEIESAHEFSKDLNIYRKSGLHLSGMSSNQLVDGKPRT